MYELGWGCKISWNFGVVSISGGGLWICIRCLCTTWMFHVELRVVLAKHTKNCRLVKTIHSCISTAPCPALRELVRDYCVQYWYKNTQDDCRSCCWFEDRESFIAASYINSFFRLSFMLPSPLNPIRVQEFRYSTRMTTFVVTQLNQNEVDPYTPVSLYQLVPDRSTVLSCRVRSPQWEPYWRLSQWPHLWSNCNCAFRRLMTTLTVTLEM